VLDGEDLRDVVKVGFVLPPIGQQPIEAHALLGILDAAFSQYFDADLMRLPRKSSSYIDGAVASGRRISFLTSFNPWPLNCCAEPRPIAICMLGDCLWTARMLREEMEPRSAWRHAVSVHHIITS
jgi:hypothetical protein